MSDRGMVTHHGACHCGAVQFDVEAPAEMTADECNCSICTMCGYLHLVVPASRFHLRAGEDQLREYQFNTRTARHFFCSVCGIKSFYVPRSNPDGYSINVRCLAPETIASLTVRAFDGQHWEANAASLRHLSRD